VPGANQVPVYGVALNLNSVASVRRRTLPTERPPLVGEVSANLGGFKLSRGQRNGSLRPYSGLSRPEPLLFLPNSRSVVLEAEWTPFQTHYFSENAVDSGIEPGPTDSEARVRFPALPHFLTTRLQRWSRGEGQPR
jgi:hypothetical protein